MQSLKFTEVASLYGNHCRLNKWFHSFASPNLTFAIRSSGNDSFGSAIFGPRSSTLWIRDRERMVSPCTSPHSPVQDKSSSLYGKLGFRGIRYKCSSDGKQAAATSVGPASQVDEPGHDCKLSASSPLSTQNNSHIQEPAPSHHSKPAKLLTLPTMLTIGRVAAVPLLVGTFYVDSWRGTTATTAIFIAASITDWLDGYIARKKDLGTAFGAFLDPVADKLMVAATLVLLCTRPFEVPIFGQAPWILTIPSIAIIGREITMSAVREWAASQNNNLSEAVAVNNLGKWKTAAQMTALTILLATRDKSLTGNGTLVATGVVLLYISAWLALWSLFVYIRKIWKVLVF